MVSLHPGLRRHPIRWLLLVVTLLVTAFFIGPKLSEAVGSLHALGGSQWGWVVVAGLAQLASLLCFSLVTYELLRPGQRPRFGRVLRLDLVSVAVSHAVPVGAAAGSAVGYELLEEEGVAGIEAGFVKVSQSLLSSVLLEVLLAVALALQLLTYGPDLGTVLLTVTGGLLLGLVAGFALLLAYRPAVIQAIGNRLLGRLPKVRPESVARVIAELSRAMRDLLRTPRRLLWISLWSLGNWLFDLLCLWAATRAFGAPPALVLLTVAFCVAQLAAALPISPAGLGVVESSLVPLLEGFGTSSDVAVLAVIAWRFFNFWMPLPLGGLAYLAIVNDRRRKLIGPRPGDLRVTDAPRGTLDAGDGVCP